MNRKLPVQKCMVEVLHKLAKLPVTIMQHNFLLFGITFMPAWLQQLNLFPATYIIKNMPQCAQKTNNYQLSRLKVATSLCHGHAKKIGDRAFSVAAPQAWNRLLTKLKSPRSTDSFRCHLKSYLYDSRVRMVDEKNGSDPIFDFTSTISVNPEPKPIHQGTANYLLTIMHNGM